MFQGRRRRRADAFLLASLALFFKLLLSPAAAATAIAAASRRRRRSNEVASLAARGVYPLEEVVLEPRQEPVEQRARLGESLRCRVLLSFFLAVVVLLLLLLLFLFLFLFLGSYLFFRVGHRLLRLPAEPVDRGHGPRRGERGRGEVLLFVLLVGGGSVRR